MIPKSLQDQLIRDESLRLGPYYDCCGKYSTCKCAKRGKLTIGVGHNLDDKPITKAAALWILQDDINDATSAVITKLPWVLQIDPVRQAALVNMAFNMGIENLLEFHNFLTSCHAHNWQQAAVDGADSLWAKQVGPRAERLMKQILTGEWQ